MPAQHSIDDAKLLELINTWFQICNKLWPLLHGLYTAESKDERQVKISLHYESIRAVSDKLAVAAEERGLDNTPYFTLIGNIDNASDQAWDDTWTLTKRLKVKAEISAPKQHDPEDGAVMTTSEGDSVDESTEGEKRPNKNRKTDPYEWLGKAILLFRDNPKRSHASIAREVGIHPGTLSKAKDFQAVVEAAKEEGLSRRKKGYLKHDSETGTTDIEAIDNSEHTE